MPLSIEKAKHLPKEPHFKKAEEQAREVLSQLFGVPLKKEKLMIFGKLKEFDLVNIRARIVGDVKRYTVKNPTAEMKEISEYVWLMEKLEASTGWKWRKIIVGAGRRSVFEKYARNYDAWLGNVEIYFMNEEGKLDKLRNGRTTN